MASDEAAVGPFMKDATGVRVAIRVTPRASRNGVDGIVIGAAGRPAFQVRLTSPPIDGAANKALIAFLADALNVPRSAIEIRSGDASRLKILHVSTGAEDIEDRLMSLIVKKSKA